MSVITGELQRSLMSYNVWGTLGWADIRLRYRRTTLGPFWITLSLGAMVLGIGILYSGLFASRQSDYILSLAGGIVAWTLINSAITEGCSVFIASAGLIKASTLPLLHYLQRMLWRNVIIFLHNAVIIVVLWLIYGLPDWIYVLPLALGLGILVVALFGISMIVSVLCTRFRDLPQIVASVLQVLFFVTPIVWMPESLKTSPLVLYLNPLYYLVEVVRSPLLGRPLPATEWLAAAGLALLSLAVGLHLFSRFRPRIAYWL